MEQETRRKGPRSPSEESDGMRRRKKYDRSPSPRRRYRRSRSRSSSRERERERSSRRKDEWSKSSMQTNKASNPPNNTGYPPPVLNQYNTAPPNTSQPPPPIQYAQGYSNYNYNYGQGYTDYSGYQQAPGYRNDYPPPNWQGNVSYNSQQQQQQQQQAAAVAAAAAAAAVQQAANMPQAGRTGGEQRSVVDPASAAAAAAQAALMAAAGNRPEEAKKEAIAAELKQQKATLAKQREEYVKKSSTLQRELEILRKQCEEIGKEGGRENNRIIKENQKLQVEIQNKMKSIHNVIDMLTGIIGDKVTVDDLKVKYKPESVKRSKSPKEDFSTGKSAVNTPNSDDRDEDSKPAYNFVHYDPEMHWCRTCDIFPKTAKEYLNHLHSNEHKEICLERKIVDMPWHDSKLSTSEKEMPYYPGLPTKRTPIKGLQFFSPATAWYCKLCNSWIGDLHCASLHLKSRRHSENYSRFVDQNPHWETDWMADREKAFSDEKHKQIQIEIQKQKEEGPQPKPKKSKKAKKNKKKTKKRKNKSSNSDSSSDSDSNESETNNGISAEDNSRSIRVAMRNKMKGSSQSLHHDEDSYGNENDDRQMVNSLRDKMKAKHDNKIDDKQEMNNTEVELQAWGPKEPPKQSFWINKKDDENKPQLLQPTPQIPKPEEMPKPHMGFWTKQQVSMTKTQDNKDKDKDRERDDDRDRDRYKDDRRPEYGNKWDRRDDKYDRYRDDRYDRRKGFHRDRDYYEGRGRRRGSDSPRHDRRDYRDGSPPKRGYGKRDEEAMDDKRMGPDSNNKMKKGPGGNQAAKKNQPQVVKGKLPFIGRLPLFKKKDDPKLPEKEVAPLPYTQSKFEDTPKVPSEIINPPGVVHVPKLATPIALPSNTAAVKAHQMKILVAPPPPTLNEKQQQDKIATAEVVDMEIEDQVEEAVIENVPGDGSKPETDTSKPPPVMPNTSRPPPGYVPKKPEPTPTPFTHQGPPPPFVTNSFMHPPGQPPVQQMPYMHQMQMPPPGMYANPPPPLPPPGEMPPGVPGVPSLPGVPGVPGVPGIPPPGVPIVAEVQETQEPTAEKRPDGAPLPEDLQEALDIIFPNDASEAEAHAQNQDSTIMYGSMYSMLGCVGYGPDYMDQPPPEITRQEPDLETAPGPDDLRMLGIDEGDTIL